MNYTLGCFSFGVYTKVMPRRHTRLHTSRVESAILFVCVSAAANHPFYVIDQRRSVQIVKRKRKRSMVFNNFFANNY